MPSAANLNRLCCWVSCKVKLFKPLKMMGSTLHGFQSGYVHAQRGGGWLFAVMRWDAMLGADIRYATTMESLRSMASSATALVRSTVSRTEFIWRRRGSKGDSRSTGGKERSIHCSSLASIFSLRPQSCSYTRYYQSSYLLATRDSCAMLSTSHALN